MGKGQSKEEELVTAALLLLLVGVRFIHLGGSFNRAQHAPNIVIVFLLVAALSAKKNPDDPRVATYARLAALTQSDFDALLAQARSGDSEAQYQVGQIYAEGRLVPKDFTVSAEWMLRSAEQGYAPAQKVVGMMYMSRNGDYGKADMWLRRAAEQGNADAQVLPLARHSV